MLRTAAFVTGMEQILRREYGLRRWGFGSRCRRLFFLSQRDFESTQRNVRMITVEDDGGEGAERSYRRVENVGELTVKEFDGEGLISREFAAFVDNRCGFRHIHSSFQIRMPYIKGVLHEVDFHSLFKELDVPYLIDTWGNRHPVNEVDMILTKSMFKAFGWMTDNGLSWEEYLERCEQYGHFLYISQFNTVKVPTQVDMNYQFLATVLRRFHIHPGVIEHGRVSVTKLVRRKPVDCNDLRIAAAGITPACLNVQIMHIRVP